MPSLVLTVVPSLICCDGLSVDSFVDRFAHSVGDSFFDFLVDAFVAYFSLTVLLAM